MGALLENRERDAEVFLISEAASGTVAVVLSSPARLDHHGPLPRGASRQVYYPRMSSLLPEGRPQPPVSLTQYGTVAQGFRNRPREGVDIDGVSVIAGRLTVDEAAKLVAGRPARRGDAVRHTTVRRLLGEGFTVRATPSRQIPGHCSVEYPGIWDDDVGRRFDGCFGPPVVKET